MFEHYVIWLSFLSVLCPQVSSGILSYLNFWGGDVEVTCSPRQFRCEGGQCIFSSWRCDGHVDCQGGEDERNCSKPVCPHDAFECDDAMCIEHDLKCDGYHDCFDGSDEKYCGEDHELATCGPGHFTCVGLRDCIVMTSRCDGEYDCPDRSDEIGCAPVESCEEDEFMCTNKSHCIPKSWRCDGRFDCPDRSDETSCEILHACTPEQGYFLCWDKESCVALTSVCDGHLDCPDRSDEANNCSARCAALDCQGSCVPTKHSAQCGCPGGFHMDPATRQCKDVNECQEASGSFCSQQCVNVPGYFHCACQAGYGLEPDRRSCRAVGPEPVLFYATATEIYGKGLNSGALGRLVHNRPLITDLAVDMRGKRVFWTEATSHKVMSAYYDERRVNAPEEVVSVGLGLPVAVAVDWVTSSLFVGDAGLGQVVVCALHRPACAVVVRNLDQLADLLLDPEARSLYYVTLGNPTSIRSCDMAGRGARVLVTGGLVRPTALALDPVKRRLYWVDQDKGTVESVQTDGTDRKIVLSWEIHHPVAVTLFQDEVFWADKVKRKISAAHKVTGHDRRTVVMDVGLLTALTVAHPVLQQDLPNACTNSGCSDLCLLSNSHYGYSCACPDGMTLMLDRRTCQMTGESKSLLVASGDAIQQLAVTHIGNAPSRQNRAGDMTRVYALDYDLVDEMVYFTDRDARGNTVVKRRLLNASSMASQTVVSGVGSVSSLAVDWVARNLFWVDADRERLELSRLDGSWRRTLLRVESPRGLALHLTKGLLFFSVWGEFARLEQCDLGGDDCWRLVDKRLWRPSALTLDYASDTLYWADPSLGEIQSVTLDDSHTVHSVAASAAPLFLAVDEGVLYWTDLNFHAVMTLDLTKGQGRASARKFFTGSGNVTGLALVRPRLGAVHNGCSGNSSGCSHICIALPDQHRMCVCPINMVSHDLKTCVHERVTCRAGQVACLLSPQCVPRSALCDGREDCLDASDEDDCPVTCRSNQFPCGNGKCLPQLWTCDGDKDCEDGSDENLPRCGHVTCASDQFLCDRVVCVPPSDICDGIVDCDDQTDEKSCNTTCSAGEFTCQDGACVDRFLLCDGDEDCAEGEDEQHCPKRTCRPDEFQCGGGQCLARALLCNGLSECRDGSDEASHTCPHRPKQPDSAGTCSSGQFRCGDGECVAAAKVCDGELDCYDASDETSLDCPEGRSGWLRCAEGQFRCDTGQCLPPSALCNGSSDCPWGEDENEDACSDADRYCPQGQFPCLSGQCLALARRCDGTPDCLDSSDEGSHCTTSCAVGRNPCNQKCLATPSGALCSCQAGFRLADPHTCEDVDECAGANPCSQHCHNTKGGYRCQCVQGYRLHSDGQLCKASGERPHLLLSYSGGLLRLTLDGHVSSVLRYDWPVYVFDSIIKTGEIFFVTKEGPSKSPSLLYKWTGNATVKMLESDMVIADVSADWLARNLYIALNRVDRGRLRMCSVDSGQCRTLKEGKDVTPRQLLVSPHRGLMVWLQTTLATGDSTTIVLASMDGSNARPLVSGLPRVVVAMAMDYVMDAVYWMNPDDRAVETIGLDGSGRRPVVRLDSFPHAASLDFFESSLFLSNWRNSVLQLSLKEDRTRLLQYLDRVMDLGVVHPLKQPPGSSPCDSKNCPYLCALTPGGAVCLCPDHYVVDSRHSSGCLAPASPRTTTLPALSMTSPPGSEPRGKVTLSPSASTAPFPHQRAPVSVGPFVETTSARCQPGFQGPGCERTLPGKGKEDGGKKTGVIVGVVIGVIVLIVVVALVIYIKRKTRHPQSLPNFIRFHPGTLLGKAEDTEELVPEIQFGNPGYQRFPDEVDEVPPNWWRYIQSS